MATVPVPQLAQFLLGSWRLERILTDRDAGLTGTFQGIASFTQQPCSTLRQEETGTLAWPSYSGPASRRYLLRQGRNPGRLAVEFDGGRPFHDLDLSTGEWTAVHRCAPDTYAVHYYVLSQDRISYEWDVHGPRKNLLLSSTLTRLH